MDQLVYWKSVKDFDRYEVSNMGRVRATRTQKIIKGWINEKGYHRLSLYAGQYTTKKGIRASRKKNQYVHRLVYAAFQGEIPVGMEVDHIDEDITNNENSNLQLLTGTENLAKRWGKEITKSDEAETAQQEEAEWLENETDVF